MDLSVDDPGAQALPGRQVRYILIDVATRILDVNKPLRPLKNRDLETTDVW